MRPFTPSHASLLPLLLLLTPLACSRSAPTASTTPAPDHRDASREAPKGESEATNDELSGSAPGESTAGESTVQAEALVPPAPAPDETEKKKERQSSASAPPAGAMGVGDGKLGDRDREAPEPTLATNSETAWAALGNAKQRLTAELAPSALSCGGARPHRDAICTIAERICALEEGARGELGPHHCEAARNACEKAKRTYDDRCASGGPTVK